MDLYSLINCIPISNRFAQKCGCYQSHSYNYFYNYFFINYFYFDFSQCAENGNGNFEAPKNKSDGEKY